MKIRWKLVKTRVSMNRTGQLMKGTITKFTKMTMRRYRRLPQNRTLYKAVLLCPIEVVLSCVTKILSSQTTG
jgi:hypothetical protein